MQIVSHFDNCLTKFLVNCSSEWTFFQMVKSFCSATCLKTWNSVTADVIFKLSTKIGYSKIDTNLTKVMTWWRVFVVKYCLCSHWKYTRKWFAEYFLILIETLLVGQFAGWGSLLIMRNYIAQLISTFSI